MSAELQAMVQLETALRDLQDEERDRVMQWVHSRFPIQAQLTSEPVAEKAAIQGGAGRAQADGASTNGASDYEDLATFYDAAAPSSDMEKALVGAYWLQVRDGTADVDAQSVNTQLKHLGHRIGNVTRAFEGPKSQKPAPIVRLRKDGNTQQARRRFKVTTAGKLVVERMLAGSE